MTEPNLQLITPGLQDEALARLNARDVLGFLCTTSSHRTLALVFDNILMLRELGIYEKALLQAFTQTNTNNRKISGYALDFMFATADRKRLRDAGEPLPPSAPYTIYRGVAGVGAARRVRGLSWTASVERAWWFALRYSQLANPAVYQTVVEDEHVLAYTNDREEQEFLVKLEPTHPLVRVAKPANLPAS